MNYYAILFPFLRLLDPEKAHGLAINMLKRGWVPKPKFHIDACLKTSILGIDFDSPLGLAAGFDKNAQAVDALMNQGFGFVEVGSVTPRPQPGNPKPRLFRLSQDQAIINRMGFNNDGAQIIGQRLKNLKKHKPLGINLGKNKTCQDAAQDYVKGIEILGKYADYVVINVSSPNTQGLRNLQQKENLTHLMGQVMEARNEWANGCPIFLKISPDLKNKEENDVIDVVMDLNIEGMIISNTTLSRPSSLRSAFYKKSGGLSGRPVFDLSTQQLKRVYGKTQGQCALIGVGGISSPRQAYDKIRAGANLIQIYCAYAYQGPEILKQIYQQLPVFLKQDGFTSIDQACGIDAY